MMFAMTKSLRLLALAAALMAAAPAMAQSRYLSMAEDIPLMPGLTEADNAGMVFDKPDGRIVEAYATGAVTTLAVTRFYAATLPQLGWRRESDFRYRREVEHLQLTVTGRDGALTLRFDIAPTER